MPDSSIASRPVSRPVTGRFVLAVLAGFFGVVLVMNLVLVRTALTSFGGVEVESAYKAGRLFGAETAAARHQNDLGWKITISVDGNRHHLLIDAEDHDGKLLGGLAGTVNFQHPADRRLDVTAPIVAAGAGTYTADLPAAAGLRTADLTLHAPDGRIFRSQNRVFLPEGAGSP